MKTPPFSVLMSLYDKELAHNLIQCLNSLKNQTVPPSEILIVLDGKINESLEAVLQEWETKLPINLIKLEKNIGLGSALNIGLKNCRYELIARMDTDDIALEERFELQLKSFITDKNLDICGTDIIEYDENIEVIRGRRKMPSHNNEIEKYIRYRNPINHMSVMFKKQAIIRAGGYKHHLFMEDYNLWIRCLSKGFKLYNINIPLLNVRTGKGMVKKRKGYKYILSEVQLFSLKRKHLEINLISNLSILIFRVFIRILPINFLNYLYKKRY
ncbi:glycosyltransferase [Alcaligenes endophyticus]|uniref:Glycosyltransferase n=1 Tax=Alcaligenes endophyticus TaxID=1929088 RepID=A0ABT8EFU8_9BURK|nr:glycosyltransferase [Alcaligenes endophyticus]MCX5590210.1 glycosyltransferase [Alcaligenes endophyticus]MDN4120127.1 glycosyltransferase [Alcaligenes endophyticus]